MAEYAQTYGHLPRPNDSWALFLSLAHKAGRFWFRRQLVMFDAVGDAVNSLFSEGSESEQIRSQLRKLAHPTTKTIGRPAVIQNEWNDGTEETTSDG